MVDGTQPGAQLLVQQRLRPVEEWLVENLVPPEWLLLTQVGLCALAGLALALAQLARPLLFLVPLCMIGRLVAGVLHGRLVERTQAKGAWTEIKRELAERVSDAAIFIGLAASGYASALLASIALTVVLLIPGVTMVSRAYGGPRQRGGWLSRPERSLSLAVFVLFPLVMGSLLGVLFNIYLLLVIIVGLLTIGQRLSGVSESLAQES
jgi:hypothetical protein